MSIVENIVEPLQHLSCIRTRRGGINLLHSFWKCCF